MGLPFPKEIKEPQIVFLRRYVEVCMFESTHVFTDVCVIAGERVISGVNLQVLSIFHLRQGHGLELRPTVTTALLTG